MADIRPMTDEDVDRCEQLWRDAWAVVDREHHIGTPATTDDDRRRWKARARHLLATDPQGAWVAVDGDDESRIVGLAVALVRGPLWVLSLLGVAPDHQDRRVGRALLDRAVAYGDGGPGLILSSPDHRAQRRYLHAGFALHPASLAYGILDRDRATRTAESANEDLADMGASPVRPGTAADLSKVDDISGRQRGGGMGPDGAFLMEAGARLYVTDDGYGFFGPQGCYCIGADSVEAARAVLISALLGTEPGSAVHVEWMTAPQQWAFETASDLGLRLQSFGAVMVRGRPGPMSPYLPSGAFA